MYRNYDNYSKKNNTGFHLLPHDDYTSFKHSIFLAITAGEIFAGIFGNRLLTILFMSDGLVTLFFFFSFFTNRCIFLCIDSSKYRNFISVFIANLSYVRKIHLFFKSSFMSLSA